MSFTITTPHVAFATYTLARTLEPLTREEACQLSPEDATDYDHGASMTEYICLDIYEGYGGTKPITLRTLDNKVNITIQAQRPEGVPVEVLKDVILDYPRFLD